MNSGNLEQLALKRLNSLYHSVCLCVARCMQGMNRLVAILLLFLDEDDAFWGLVAIIESLMPAQYYDRTMIAAHADQVSDHTLLVSQ